MAIVDKLIYIFPNSQKNQSYIIKERVLLKIKLTNVLIFIFN